MFSQELWVYALIAYVGVTFIPGWFMFFRVMWKDRSSNNEFYELVVSSSAATLAGVFCVFGWWLFIGDILKAINGKHLNRAARSIGNTLAGDRKENKRA